MTVTYIDLVNRLRDRFNEVRLTVSNWSSTVGFDQFTKDAINYAYRDIINAELEWPFSHISATLYTIPGVQLYDVVANGVYSVPSGYMVELDTIDWESFYIGNNQTLETFTNESHVIPSSGSGPYQVTVSNINTTSTISGNTRNFYTDSGVTIGGLAATAVTGQPAATLQYNVSNGIYTFATADKGATALISYQTAAADSYTPVGPISALKLSYIDYDLWRQIYLGTDLNNITSQYSKPQFVFKPQVHGQIGLSPVPDKVYNIFCEFWLDATELSNTTDVPLIPIHFYNVIIDGAQKYCYEFREDPQLAQMADARFKAGIARMRIELINRRSDMNAGFYWYPHGRLNGYWNGF